MKHSIITLLVLEEFFCRHFSYYYKLLNFNLMKSRLFLFNFAAPSRLDDELFINKNVQPPGVIRFHPYEPHLAVADKTGVSIWNFEEGSKLNHFNNGNPKTSRITSLDILNEHDLSLLLTGSGMLVDLNVYVNYWHHLSEIVWDAPRFLYFGKVWGPFRCLRL